jgi:hypothetical protein
MKSQIKNIKFLNLAFSNGVFYLIFAIFDLTFKTFKISNNY